MKFFVAVIPGDGIGPEIIKQSMAVLDDIGEKYQHHFTFVEVPAGGIAIDEFGIPLPEKTVSICKKSDSILLGAVGGPKWDNLILKLRPEKALLDLRRELGLFANLRPAVLHEPLRDACPLRSDIAEQGIDVCIVRELTGGIYYGAQGERDGSQGREAFDTECYSENEIERIARAAFRLAGMRRKKVTSVDKANVLQSSRLWRKVVTETALEYPGMQLEHLYVDNAAMQLIREPHQFDVILTNNMFGDILSDEASMITGSIGMLPSASVSETHWGIFEPIHGSAPDIAGLDKGNPIAAILSAAMMLRLSFECEIEAQAIETAVDAVLRQDFRTADIMSPGKHLVGTRKMGELIRKALH